MIDNRGEITGQPPQGNQRYPEIQIVLYESTTPEALLAIENGEFDLAIICGEGGVPWQKDDLVLVTSPRSEFAKRTADIDDAPFITFPKGSTTHGLLLQAFPKAQVVMELSGIGAIVNNVRAGVGVALVSKRAVERDLKARTLVVVKDPRTPIRRTLSLVHRGTDRMPPAMRAFYTLITNAPASEASYRRGHGMDRALSTTARPRAQSRRGRYAQRT